MKYLLLPVFLILAACADAPKIVAGKGGVYGTVFTDSHPLFKKKMEHGSSSLYGEPQGYGVKYRDDMVNYAELDDLYVGLAPVNLPLRQHHVTATAEGMSPKSIALATGDSVHLHNQTDRDQSFFVVKSGGTDKDIQAFPAVPAGAAADVKIDLEGDLELLSEDNDKLKTVVFSKKNMLAKRVASGGSYQFDNLEPGSYQLIFWYWRLGKIQQTVQVPAGDNVRVDKVLTVDSVVNLH
ncbi:MAG: hypothetical protein ACXWF8_10930 [Methylobacter sp.]